MIGRKHQVLDKGHVILTSAKTLIDGQPDLDLAVVQAARASTTTGWKQGFTGLKGAEADTKLLRYLWKNGHHSPWEHVVFTFHVKAPILVTRQWMRHRTWSYNVQSGRYQEYEDEFYIPETWRLQDTKNKQGSVLNDDEDPVIHLGFVKTIEQGVAAYQVALRRGIAREQARLFLPAFALYEEFYATVDLRNLLAFIRERSSPAAQYEIRAYSDTIRDILRVMCPLTMELAFPNA